MVLHTKIVLNGYYGYYGYSFDKVWRQSVGCVNRFSVKPAVGEIGPRWRRSSLPEGAQAAAVDSVSARAAMSAHEGYVCGRARTTPARQAHGTRGSAPPRAGRPRCSAKSRGGTRAHQTQHARSASPRSKRRCKVHASGRLWSGQSAPAARGLPNGHSLLARLRKRGRWSLARRTPATVARAASWGVCGLYACMSNDAEECGWRGLRSGGAAWTDPWCCFQERVCGRVAQELRCHASGQWSREGEAAADCRSAVSGQIREGEHIKIEGGGQPVASASFWIGHERRQQSDCNQSLRGRCVYAHRPRIGRPEPTGGGHGAHA